MDDEDLIEEIDDVEEQPSSFNRRTMGGVNRNSIPNALQGRSLNRKNNTNKNSSNASGSPKGNAKNNSLKKPIAPKDSSIANKLKKKNKPSFFNRGNKKNNNSADETNNTNEQSNEQSGEGDNSVEDVVVKAKRTILYIKIGLIAAGVIFVFVLIVGIISYFSSVLGISMDFSSLGTTANIDSNADYYKEASLYQEKLKNATKKYSESCGVYLDDAYIHATLSYIWNIADLGYDEKKQYQVMADNVDDVVDLMVTNCVVDYEIDGTFYNKLVNSDFLKRYYSVPLEYMDSKSIVTGIFEYAKLGIELSMLNSGFLSDNLKVAMGTCEQPYNKKLLNEGSNYPSTIGFADYLMGVLHGEITNSIKKEYIEFLKAHTIAAASVALGNSKYEVGDEEIWVHNGTCWQVSCDIYEGCTSCKDFNTRFTTALTGYNRSCNNVGRRIQPMSEENKKILEEVFNEVYGIVMFDNSTNKIKVPQYRDTVKTCGSTPECMGQTEAARDANNGLTYQEILAKYYTNFTLTNMREDSYVGEVSYNSGGYDGNVVFYAQTDYNDRFCGLKGTIKSDGCGVTSMAMILSTMLDRKYTPPVVMQEAYGGKFCGGSISGTAVTFFKYSAEKHGLGYSAVSKSGDKQLVLNALQSGNSLVVAHMGPGDFTNGGHYIVLTKTNDKGEVYVLDPYKSRKTGWHSFDKVVKQLKSYGSFHIITKR